jgi:chitin synthase
LKLQKQIVNAQIILQQFGSARTVQNTSASGFGQFQELQYNERGRIIGLKTMTYNLDRSRLTHVPQNERNFHVFYSLLSGTSTEERTALRINHAPEYFAYLSQTRNTKVIDAGDQIAFGDLKAALKVCGFKSKTVTQLFQVLAAVLHFGNLQFIDPASDAQDSCSVKNTEELDIIAGIFGVSPSKLESTITYHLRYVGKELCTAFLNAQAAVQQRDAIARAIYGAIFNWIVEMINTKLCCPEEEVCNFVGILDQFGFQNFKSNRFEHFTVNFANEAIDNFLAQEQPQERLMAEDGVSMPTIPPPASDNCIALLTGTATGVPRTIGGLIGTIDKESKRYLVNETDATDANLLGLLDKLYSSHVCYAKSSQTFTFGINHYSEAVYYSIDSFLEKNTDNISPDFINLLRSSSSNDFVLNLFQNDNLATKSHPHDERTIIKAQLPTRSMRAPSMKRPTVETDVTNEKTNDKSKDEIESPQAEDREITSMKSTLDQLGETLSSLIASIQGTRIHKVLHIRPNDLQAPDQFNIAKVKMQVRGLQILDLHSRCSVNYSVMYPIPEFLSHYASLPSMTNDGNERDRVMKLFEQHNWTQEMAYVGKDNVWLGFDAWKSIEDDIRRKEKEHRLNQKASVTGSSPILAGDFLSPNSARNGMPLLPPHPDFHDDRGSYIESDDEAKKYEGSQWGEESDWGGKVAADG